MPADPDALDGDVLDPAPPDAPDPPACVECGRLVAGEVVRALDAGLRCSPCDGGFDGEA